MNKNYLTAAQQFIYFHICKQNTTFSNVEYLNWLFFVVKKW